MLALDGAAGPVLKIHFSVHPESHLVFPRCFAVVITWHTWWYLGTNWAKVTLIEVYWNWRTSTMKVTTYWRKHRRKAERLGTRWTQDVLSNTVVNSLCVVNTWNDRPRGLKSRETAKLINIPTKQISGNVPNWYFSYTVLKITYFTKTKQKFRIFFLYTIWMKTCRWRTETLLWLWN